MEWWSDGVLEWWSGGWDKWDAGANRSPNLKTGEATGGECRSIGVLECWMGQMGRLERTARLTSKPAKSEMLWADPKGAQKLRCVGIWLLKQIVTFSEVK